MNVERANDVTLSNGYPSPIREPGSDLNWLLANFVEHTPGANEAVAVSADGFLLAGSRGTTGDGVEQFAAIIAGLNSLTRGAAELYQYEDVTQVIVEMTRGNLFVMAVDAGSMIGVLADEETDIGAIAYGMTILIDRVGTLLTPELLDELKNTIALRARPQ